MRDTFKNSLEDRYLEEVASYTAPVPHIPNRPAQWILKGDMPQIVKTIKKTNRFQM